MLKAHQDFRRRVSSLHQLLYRSEGGILIKCDTMTKMKVLSDLNESDLRHLFSIVERDYPDALASSIASLFHECDDDEETNEIESLQPLETSEEDESVEEDKVVSSDIDQDNVTSVPNSTPPSPVLTPIITSIITPTSNPSLSSSPSPSSSPSSSSTTPNPTPAHTLTLAPSTPPMTPPKTPRVVPTMVPPMVPASTPPPPPPSTPPTPPTLTLAPTVTATIKPLPRAPSIASEEGCYLHYEASSAKLKLQYSKSRVSNAIGFYSASTIPGFKFKKNFGRAELIGNCASGVQGRKNYYSGWCQFIRAARSALRAELECYGEIKGELYLYPRREGDQGLDVDIYAYDQMCTIQTTMLPINTPIQNIVCAADAVACLPKHNDIFVDVKQMDFNRWLTEANNVGATSRMTSESSVPKPQRSPQRASNLYSIKKFTSVQTKPSFSSKTTDINAETTTTEQQGEHVYTNPVKMDVKEDSEEEISLPGDQSEVEGCYLLYDSDSCKLMLRYSKTLVKNAIGFYCAGAGHSIQAFKFKRNFGRAELIGNCASGVTGRKNFYSGWCQFIRAARAINGSLWIYPRKKNVQGLDVDIYVYYQNPKELNMGDYQTVKLIQKEKLNVTDTDGVACVPKFTDFFEELKLVEINRWLTEGNTIGATSRFT